jgi:acetoin utilization deacetylase AcuC-like enzyme
VQVVFSEAHRLHEPRHDIQGGAAAPTVECAERAERILQTLQRDAHFAVRPPTEHGVAPVEAVHAAGLIAFLQSARPAPDEELFPDSFLHPGLRADMPPPADEPTLRAGRLGYWCFDTGTPLLSGTYAAARGSVDVALTAADLILQGEPLAYGLCRPPGHHAARSVYGGFCYFNNAAIAAEYVVQHTASKVAIVDIDYHHGNGTQAIFYSRPDVLYCSLHADPRREFPFFTGHADETGTGAGRGTTLNVPLPPAIDDVRYLAALDDALEVVRQYAPAVTIVSLGIDTYVHDPLGDFVLTTPVYRECGKRLSGLPGLVVLQEGGYYLPDLGDNVRAFLLGASDSER